MAPASLDISGDFLPWLEAWFQTLPSWIDVDWSGELATERADHRFIGIDDRAFEPATLSGDIRYDLTGALDGEIVGGACELAFSIGDDVSGTYPFYIRGKNPRDAIARAYIDANVDEEFRPYAWMIAKHESRVGNRMYNQFNPMAGKYKEKPNYGFPNGWGIAQIDKGSNGVSTVEIYDWHANVASMNMALRSKRQRYLEIIQLYRNAYQNNPNVQWVEPDTVITNVNGMLISARQWSILTLYNGAKDTHPMPFPGHAHEHTPIHFDPGTSEWSLFENTNHYVSAVIGDLSITEVELMKFFPPILVVLAALCANAQKEHVDFKSSHRQLLRDHFDTSYWQEIWPPNLWHLNSIFVDMDGDGIEEMIAITTSEEDRMGDYWKVWERGGQPNFQIKRNSGNIYFTCHWESFYKLSYWNRCPKVVGLNLNAEKRDGEDNHFVRITADCEFTPIHDDGTYALNELRPSLDKIFHHSDIASIERLYPEWYFGFDFAPPENKPHSPYLQSMPYRMPIGDLAPGGGISEPEGFQTFVDGYIRDIRQRMDWSADIVAFAIFLDADNDGDTDCYVSSNVEQIGDGRYNWTLFLQRGKLLAKSGKAVSPAPENKGCSKLPPTVAAGKSSFCRVIRYDIPPSFLILDDTVEDSTVVRDTAMMYSVHRIEKLDCVTFPE